MTRRVAATQPTLSVNGCRSSRDRGLVALTAVGLLLIESVCGDQSWDMSPLNIMPLGDSIT
jgi:hypothetical protein